MSTLTQALAKKVASSLSKATLKSENGTKITAMYNPKTYTHAVSNGFQKKDGIIDFQIFQQDALELEFFFDTYDTKKDVRETTKKIAKLAEPAVSNKSIKRPPLVTFSWGGFSYKGMITKVKQQFDMFLPTGKPVRAKVTVTLEESKTEQQAQKDKGNVNCRKLWIVKTGDRLDLIAERIYQDHTKWKEIAKENNIIRPLTFPTADDIGTPLLIPEIYK